MVTDASRSRRSDAVDRWLEAHRDDPDLPTLAMLCETIEASDQRLLCEIKWNAPSYAVTDHFATTGLMPKGGVRLVLHSGAVKREVPVQLRGVVEDATGLLVWKGPDRAVATFRSVEEVQAHSGALTRILQRWIELTQ